MEPQDRIEESHGMWELAIVRLATMIEVGASTDKVEEAVRIERHAFAHWSNTSQKSIEESEGKI